MKKLPPGAWLAIGIAIGAGAAAVVIRGSSALGTPMWTEAIAWQGWAGSLLSALVTVGAAWLVFRGTIRHERQQTRAANEAAAEAERARAIHMAAADAMSAGIRKSEDRTGEMAAALFRLHALALRDHPSLAEWAQEGGMTIWETSDAGVAGGLAGASNAALDRWLRGTDISSVLTADFWPTLKSKLEEQAASKDRKGRKA